MNSDDKRVLAATAAALLAIAIVLLLRTPGWPAGWDGDPELETWFQTQTVRFCCDHRDSYLANDIADDGHGGYLAIITDGSANIEYDKPAIPNGTRIPVPREAFRSQPPVPGGRGIIFLSKDYSVPPEKRQVFCYFPPPLF